MRQRYTERTWELYEQGYEQEIIEEERPRIEGQKDKQKNLIELL
jgi:hypothetical protein